MQDGTCGDVFECEWKNDKAHSIEKVASNIQNKRSIASN